MRRYKTIILPCIAWAVIAACGSGKEQEKSTAPGNSNNETAKQIQVPSFNADSAYYFIYQQVNMGPRLPGSAAQKNCASWMQETLTKVCDTVYRQNTNVKGGDGKTLPCINLIGVIHPQASHRILFLTHWDCRPWADMDTKDKDKPILAADDAASGVAVLLEVASQLKTQAIPKDLGIDILFTDVEDYGKNEWGEDSYCLGTQYWAHNPHVINYKADFGILLDMVGAANAQFPLEGLSTQFAGNVQQMVWQAAGQAGFSSYFLYNPAAAITDDHVPVNKTINIPTIDIINLRTDGSGPFAPHWHTHIDNMQIIDKNTLKAVGQSLLQVIYNRAGDLAPTVSVK